MREFLNGCDWLPRGMPFGLKLMLFAVVFTALAAAELTMFGLPWYMLAKLV